MAIDAESADSPGFAIARQWEGQLRKRGVGVGGWGWGVAAEQ